jgi:hypothetical protein
MCKFVQAVLIVVAIFLQALGYANAQGPATSAEIRFAARYAPEIIGEVGPPLAGVVRSFAPQFAGAVRTTFFDMAKMFTGIELRGTAAATVERRMIFAALPRIQGERFVLVVDRTKFELSGKISLSTSGSISLPIMFADDSDAPPHFASAVAQRCPNGWAIFEYDGILPNGNETFVVHCYA